MKSHLSHAAARATLGSIAIPSRHTFLQERFEVLSSAEQAMVLSRLMNRGNTRTKNTSLIEAATFSEATSADKRIETFDALLKSGLCIDEVSSSLLSQKENYFPALLQALCAAYNGDELGLLTARGNRRGHGSLLTAINSFLGVKIPRRNTYFVNDSRLNTRLGDKSTAEKKLHVLCDFATGEYVDAQGEIKPLSKKYQKVFFYDDEDKNLSTVSSYAIGNNFEKVLFAVDARTLNAQNLWNELLQRLDQKSIVRLGDNNVIHFFDIDGTLIQLEASIYVVDTGSNQRLLTISQEAFAEEPTAAVWFERVDPLQTLTLSLDFSDFADKSRIQSQVEQRTPENRIFKKL
jgi:hypothetical protein